MILRSLRNHNFVPILATGVSALAFFALSMIWATPVMA